MIEVIQEIAYFTPNLAIVTKSRRGSSDADPNVLQFLVHAHIHLY